MHGINLLSRYETIAKSVIVWHLSLGPQFFVDNIVVDMIPDCQTPSQLSVVSGTENIVR
jgi:hypothetical protein